MPDLAMTMNHSLARHLLLRFLVISIALHLCLLVEFRQPLLIAPDRIPGQSVLDVQLQDYTPLPAQTPFSRTVTGPRTTKKSGFRSEVPAEIIAGSSSSASTADTETRVHVPATERPQEGLRNQLLGELRTRLSRYLTYPSLARKHGWEGTVLLGLRVEPDGQLDRIRLERSSGYAVLDNSALNSLKRIGNLDEARVWLQGRSVDMQLPVIYRLIEN
jgi:protein TonB